MAAALHPLRLAAYQIARPTFALEALRQLTVAVGISGGVDSAVAAMLLKRQGHDVVGIFMRNWDEAEERDNQNCSVERDFKDATAVCHQLDIALHHVDFVAKYWNHVFTDFIAECGRGLTPNPDLACNRHIKFDALIQQARALGADAVATGHYARLLPTNEGDIQLHKGRDPDKDQSYFLASIKPSVLPHVMFPLGSMLKSEVRQLAQEAGLVTADKRSSAGICFIGRRNFADFLADYVPVVPGTFIDVDTRRTLGPCPNITAVTVGQRAGLGGGPNRTYVVGKDMGMRVVYVGAGRDHPALFTRTALLRTPHWLSPRHAAVMQNQGRLRCEYRARYRQPALPCVLRNGDVSEFKPSAYTVLSDVDAVVQPGYLVVEFDDPAKAITPQQALVMYDGEQCLGSCVIGVPGVSVAEEKGAAGVVVDNCV